MNIIKKIFKWDMSQFLQAVFGVFLYCFAVNIFISANGLYTGGVLGLAQLMRSVLINTFGIKFSFDISSVFYYLMNIPLFIIAYKKISKTFFARTLFSVSLQSVFLILIPTLKTPIVDDLLTSVIIGGIIDGVGMGLLLSAGSCSGGTDIIGIALTKNNKDLSVGKIGLAINVVVYGISGILYGISTMIYSIILSALSSLMLDHTHKQNITSTAFVFTKTKPTKMMEYIKDELHRDATYWEAVGGYTQTKTFITYTVLSKYELQRLERHMKEFDKNAFLVKQDGVGVKGEFNKNLIES